MEDYLHFIQRLIQENKTIQISGQFCLQQQNGEFNMSISYPVHIGQLYEYGYFTTEDIDLATVIPSEKPPMLLQTVVEIHKKIERLQHCKENISISSFGKYYKHHAVYSKWIQTERKTNLHIPAVDLSPVFDFNFASLTKQPNQHTIVITAGVHDREWTAIYTGLQLIKKLMWILEEIDKGGKQNTFQTLLRLGYRALAKFRFIIVPVFDLYGFLETVRVDSNGKYPSRLNRKQLDIAPDPNRNNLAFFGAVPENKHETSVAGIVPCSRCFYGLLETVTNTLFLYIDLHSYGNYIMFEPLQPYEEYREALVKYGTFRNFIGELEEYKMIEMCTMTKKHLDNLKGTVLSLLKKRNSEIKPRPNNNFFSGTILQTALFRYGCPAFVIETGADADEFFLSENNRLLSEKLVDDLLQVFVSMETIATDYYKLKNNKNSAIAKLKSKYGS